MNRSVIHDQLSVYDEAVALGSLRFFRSPADTVANRPPCSRPQTTISSFTRTLNVYTKLRIAPKITSANSFGSDFSGQFLQLLSNQIRNISVICTFCKRTADLELFPDSHPAHNT